MSHKCVRLRPGAQRDAGSGMDQNLEAGVTSSSALPDADPTWARLEDQLGWYDRKSMSCQAAYKRTKLAQLVVAAAVPVLALADVAAVATAVAAAVVVVLEGVQQLYQ